jgi:hypothetical protein
MRRQIPFAHTGALGLLQDFTDFLERKELRDHAETDIVGNPAASR